MDLERTRVTTPFNGSVASLRVAPGQWVESGQELMTLVDLDPIRVEVSVLEGEIQHISRGSAARVSFAAFPGEFFPGIVEMVNPIVEKGTRGARVTIVTSNPHQKILPGMYARVGFDARRFDNRLVVHRNAILRREGKTLLFVHEGGRAHWRYVATGVQNDSLVEILPVQGTVLPNPGDVVLTVGHQMLVHDARVQLAPQTQTAPSETQP
jgi:RND family efflux transporter MFP subunit